MDGHYVKIWNSKFMNSLKGSRVAQRRNMSGFSRKPVEFDAKVKGTMTFSGGLDAAGLPFITVLLRLMYNAFLNFD